MDREAKDMVVGMPAKRSPEGKGADAEPADGALDKEQAKEQADAKAHAEEFTKLTGMSPKRCFRLMLLSYALRMVSICWIGMVSLEYARYYVTNDLGFSDALRAATASPVCALQAFLFPFWGVVADRVSRKKVLVAACVACCTSSWLLTIVPSVEIFILTNLLRLVSDLALPIRDAMLRDVFTAREWESYKGGATGVKARMFVVGQVAFMLATFVGMTLLKLGEYGIGLPNEYQLHKYECSPTYCLPRGHFSWTGSWSVDGCLRLLMIMGSMATTLEVLVVACLFPETLRPETRAERGIGSFLKAHWREIGRPWNNLRVLATSQLRSLMFIRFLGYIIGAGWISIFLSFYNRFQFDTFTMTVHVSLAGIATWLTTMAVPCLVDRYGDLRGVWLPGSVLLTIYGLVSMLLPSGYGFVVYGTYPLLGGPALGLSAMAPELLPKLIPGDVQGTYQTSKAVVFHLTAAVFTMPWNLLFRQTQQLAYPFDGIPIFVALCIGTLKLVLTLRKLRDDPRDAIVSGKALEDFWKTPYAQGPWYQYHSGNTSHMPRKSKPASPGPDQSNPDVANDTLPNAEGLEKSCAEREEVDGRAHEHPREADARCEV